MAVSDDDIIRKKLLFEGVGGSDNSCITLLLKHFIKWSNSSESSEESNAAYQNMLMMLAQCETAMKKSLHVYRMNLGEQENYIALNKSIESSIEEAHERIAECKNELQQAKRVRKNRQEYDVLAKVIQTHPDRQDTKRQLERLGKELESQNQTVEALQQKLELRKKQFHVLVTAIHEMQKTLEEDDQIQQTDEASMEAS